MRLMVCIGMGKGSAPRPFTDREQFDANYDAIFRKDNGDERTDRSIESTDTGHEPTD